MLSVVLSAYLPWILGVFVLVVLPVTLRLFAGDDPRNEINHEQGEDEPQEPEPEGVLTAAA